MTAAWGISETPASHGVNACPRSNFRKRSDAARTGIHAACASAAPFMSWPLPRLGGTTGKDGRNRASPTAAKSSCQLRAPACLGRMALGLECVFLRQPRNGLQWSPDYALANRALNERV